ncbi:Os08g0189750 [Oryza sativa Japonica Group]|uniref:Os08g0189750 protein n=1 Tax=Oryza sativa subsp. japonica TaxID=39947 RepID=A0A0P0XCW7_ORYSJ|nr:Os08g0189750 [Oryza sativa Japonica Group]
MDLAEWWSRGPLDLIHKSLRTTKSDSHELEGRRIQPVQTAQEQHPPLVISVGGSLISSSPGCLELDVMTMVRMLHHGDHE